MCHAQVVAPGVSLATTHTLSRAPHSVMGSIARSTFPNQAAQSFSGPLPSIKPYVVVIFGRTGVGISSLVNLITGHPISNDHPNAKTSTQKQKLKPYPPVTLPGSDKQFCLYEVPGFCGQFSDETILQAISQIDRKDGIDLFIYCLRKQKMTVMPKIVRRMRQSVAGQGVPMIAVVTELERFEAEGGMEDWWDASLGGGSTNGTSIERMCFEEYDTFDAHACVTTLPRKEVDLVQTLRKRRERSEERIRRLILEQCTGHKRRGK
ncbi:hypothetical protein J3R83DRAFT_5175 [Lanmaoa asiatica]|nr:hypothetical protein J3R83DRAFT_5175 [Lanmaoa asiatica]